MNTDTFTPYSGLGSLLHRNGHLLSTTEQDREAAETAAFSLASGLGVIGKMLIHCDAKQLGPADLTTFGDFLVTTGEVLGSLLNIASHDAPGTTAEASPTTA
ncbi:hypothetical protein [uncultured Thiodictyon sp.]|uniref:hypothetical protein n=1 Tax=uncultured Thiodictyon sp. TaxID=1846217 RepID=UPI0025E8297D|nr:hypothetical protein [uncultured Thiodictyon sp.]